MSKLYEARRSNLSNPLTKDEVGYTFNCENINYIINNIDEEKIWLIFNWWHCWNWKKQFG